MRLFSVLTVFMGVFLIASASSGQTTTPQNQVAILPVRGNVYMLVGPSGNTTAQIGNDGVLVVDTMTEDAANALLSAIRSLSMKPIRWIINTHVHRDRTGGNAVLGSSGKF